MSVIVAQPLMGTDRRRWPRASVRLPVHVIDTEGSFGVVTGETVDIGVGGLRALVDGPLAGTIEATVQLDLLDGNALVCRALIAGGGAQGDAWEYRLAFRNLEPDEIEALSRLVVAHAA